LRLKKVRGKKLPSAGDPPLSIPSARGGKLRHRRTGPAAPMPASRGWVAVRRGGFLICKSLREIGRLFCVWGVPWKFYRTGHRGENMEICYSDEMKYKILLL